MTVTKQLSIKFPAVQNIVSRTPKEHYWQREKVKSHALEQQKYNLSICESNGKENIYTEIIVQVKEYAYTVITGPYCASITVYTHSSNDTRLICVLKQMLFC